MVPLLSLRCDTGHQVPALLVTHSGLEPELYAKKDPAHPGRVLLRETSSSAVS
jgi:hypothetical protein